MFSASIEVLLVTLNKAILFTTTSILCATLQLIDLGMRAFILFAVGLNILLIDNAKSYVVLSANFADLKKLANKFLPGSVVDGVSGIFDEFVKPFNKSNLKSMNFTAEMEAIDISKENLKYEDEEGKSKKRKEIKKSKELKKSPRIGEENSSKNIPDRTKESKNKFPKKVKKLDIYPEKLREEAKNESRESNSVESRDGEGIEHSETKESSEETTSTSPKVTDPDSQQILRQGDNRSDNSDDNIKPSEEESKDNKESKDTKDSGQHRDSRDSKGTSSDTSNESEKAQNDFQPKTGDVPSVYFDQNFRRLSLTTARERNEFDQYYAFLPHFDYART